MYLPVLFSFLTVLSTLSVVNCGLLDIFNGKSDYNLHTMLDTAIAIGINDVELLLTRKVGTPIEKDVTFWCGNRDSPKTQTFLDDPEIRQKINFSKPIMFITHGWLDDHDKHWIQDTAQAAFDHIDINVCIVGWGNLARYVYHQSATKHTLLVSAYMTKFIKSVNQQGMPLDNITLAGHSLGAQICGQVGYNFDGKIAEIYGLDPAGPFFTIPHDFGLENRLDQSDAKYVQMIITSRNTLGVGKGEGHGNFYVNGGNVPQPNCIIPVTSDAEMADQIICSHLHAPTLFRLSFDPAHRFKGRQCFDWISYLEKKCQENPADLMGVYNQKLHGDFYLITLPKEPFV